MRRIISFLTAFAMVVFLTLPAFASDYGTEVQSNLWEKILADNNASSHSNFFSEWVGSLGGYVSSRLSQNVCADSSDGFHHSKSGTRKSAGVDGDKHYVVMTCDDCGKDFKYYADDLKDDYEHMLTDNNLDNSVAVTPSGYIIYYLDYNSSFVSRVNSIVVSPYVLVSDSVLSNHIYSRVLKYNGSTPLTSGIYSASFNFSGSYPFSGICRLCFSNTVNDGGGSYQSDFVTVMVDNTFNISFSGDANAGTFNRSSPLLPDDFLYQSFGPLYLEYISVSGVSPSVPSIPSSINIDNNDYSVRDFNFSTRTYNVTNEDGDDITIEYGDNNYTVTNNTTNTTNNYYYYITNNNGGDDSGGGGSGSGGSGKDYTDILTQIRDLCAQILEKIGIGGGSGGDNPPLPVDIPDSSSDAVDPQKMPDFLFNFSNKFLFVNDIYQITLQLVRDITNDKFTAYNYPDGVINLPELKSIHVPAPDQPGEESGEGETSPSGGSPSGPGGSITGVSVPTAPAVSFMFPEYDFYGFNFGGYAVLDFSWYAPYKSRVDGLLSGFLWAGFLWLLFKRLPGIIHGSSMAADTVNYIDNASSDKTLWGGS